MRVPVVRVMDKMDRGVSSSLRPVGGIIIMNGRWEVESVCSVPKVTQ